MQESHFWWVPAMYTISNDWEVRSMHRDGYNGAIAAFTVAELGELLKPIGSIETIPQTKGDTLVHFGLGKPEECFFADTEADARAKMLVYLLENGLMK